VSDIDTAVVDSLKAFDPKRPIREATEQRTSRQVRVVPISDIAALFDAHADRIAIRHVVAAPRECVINQLRRQHTTGPHRLSTSPSWRIVKPLHLGLRSRNRSG
jgi:hypothetical protein